MCGFLDLRCFQTIRQPQLQVHSYTKHTIDVHSVYMYIALMPIYARATIVRFRSYINLCRLSSFPSAETHPSLDVYVYTRETLCALSLFYFETLR